MYCNEIKMWPLQYSNKVSYVSQDKQKVFSTVFCLQTLTATTGLCKMTSCPVKLIEGTGDRKSTTVLLLWQWLSAFTPSCQEQVYAVSRFKIFTSQLQIYDGVDLKGASASTGTVSHAGKTQSYKLAGTISHWRGASRFGWARHTEWKQSSYTSQWIPLSLIVEESWSVHELDSWGGKKLLTQHSGIVVCVGLCWMDSQSLLE